MVTGGIEVSYNGHITTSYDQCIAVSYYQSTTAFNANTDHECVVGTPPLKTNTDTT